MGSRTRIGTAVAALAAAAVTVALAGCGGDEPSAQLAALEEDPMAAYEPAGAELVDTEEQSEGETTLGKPQLARHARVFALGAADGEEALEAALAAARDAGWTFEGPVQDGVGGKVGLATKRLETGRARLAVSLLTDERVLREGVSPPALKISLEHLGS